MSLQTKKEIGDFGEKRAARYLFLRGYRIRERNWRYGKGEIDLIVSSLHDVAFVEVKTRVYTPDQLLSAPPPRDAVHAEKQRITRRTAQHYLAMHPTRKQPRMDVIEVRLVRETPDSRPRVAQIHHIKAAY
jgi:putative endonuclease